jgi:hypothetical protein
MEIPETTGYEAPPGPPRTVHHVNAIFPKVIPVPDVAKIIRKEHGDRLR